eukprot:gnl/Dysnectes_brevis/721_a794_1953.p1 GENE.gnl/Dysnectes_brevis/721_a794_1953~~gnl/Dysnectes_brevis/721_a794_1953.p1  ORF type:complete len:382 (-),score=143.77 gnl/Dysnectes_brevis/721_a794_1953:97-1242(-)
MSSPNTDDQVCPLMKCTHLVFQYTLQDDDDIKEQILDIVKKNTMRGYLDHLIHKFSWSVTPEFINEIIADFETQKEACEAAIAEAKEKMGDADMVTAIYQLALLYGSTGDKKHAIKTFDSIGLKSLTHITRFTFRTLLARLGWATQDDTLVDEQLALASLIPTLGYEQRTTLDLYKAITDLKARRFEDAVRRLQPAIMTFAAEELMTYAQFVCYLVIASLVAMDRAKLLKEIYNNVDILAALVEQPDAKEAIECLAKCRYSRLQHAVVGAERIAEKDWTLHSHCTALCRALRLRAYQQYLTAFRTATLRRMSMEFGMPVPLLLNELEFFIAGGQLEARLDLVAMTAQMRPVDPRETAYLSLEREAGSVIQQLETLRKSIML